VLKKKVCQICGGSTKIPHPPRFSPDDKYIKYKMLLKEGFIDEGNID
jgi:H/ACA ribonucleoprotein complex subunit 3